MLNHFVLLYIHENVEPYIFKNRTQLEWLRFVQS